MKIENVAFDNRIRTNIERNSFEYFANDPSNEQENILPFASNILSKLENKELKKAIEMFPSIRQLVQKMEKLQLENNLFLDENISLGEKIDSLNFYKKSSLGKINDCEKIISQVDLLKRENRELQNSMSHLKEQYQKTIDENIKSYNNNMLKLQREIAEKDKLISSKFKLKMMQELKEKDEKINQMALKPKISTEKIEEIEELHLCGLTQKEIAEKVNVSSSTVNKYLKKYKKN